MEMYLIQRRKIAMETCIITRQRYILIILLDVQRRYFRMK